MKMIEAYLYEVTRRLPEKMRDDIALELRSTIADMLPESYTENEVKEVLSKLGDPAQLAASYRDTPMHLIGPKVYDGYIWTMKMIIPWAILITILVHVVEAIVLFSGEVSILSVLIKSFGIIIGNIIQVLIQTFFWVTITFIIIDRIGLANSNVANPKSGWTPKQLKHVIVVSRKKAIPRSEIIFGLVWIVIWIVVYFNANHLAGVYRSIDGKGLQMVMPAFNQGILMSYLPIVLALAVLDIGVTLYKWKERKWTLKLVTLNAVVKLLGLIVFIVIASNPALINEAMIPYMADLVETNVSSIYNFLDWTVWTIVMIVIVTVAIEVYDSYRKARIQ